MKANYNFLLAILMLLITQISFAQVQSVSGVVTDQNGVPIPGVNVTVKNNKTGTQTDLDGKFKITASQNQVLVFSFLGMKTKEVTVKSSVLNLNLEDDAKELNDVVVTAFGIKRNPKKLGYSVSSVKTDDLVENAEPDLIRSLNGKVAGVNVNVSTGVAGAANQITIRGTTTFTGNTQPLIIVDGIAYSNDQVTSSSQTTGGGGYESGISSLDPNDIATFNVLKSSAAAALYGSRAVNGVIVITTKSGSSGAKKNKLSVNVGIGNAFEQIANLPEYQNTYGAGANFAYSNANGSWGPRFDSQATIPTWPTLLAAFPSQFGPTVPYVAKPNNVKDLFRTGSVTSKTLGLSYAGEDGSFNMTLSDLRQDGYIPFNTYYKTSISIGGSFKLNERFTFGGNMSYSKTNQIGGFFGENQFQGASSSFARALFLARNWDLNLPYINPVTGASVTPNGVQFDHPLWSWEHDKITTTTNRIVAGGNMSYKFNEHISASYRAGINKYSLDRDEVRDLGSRASDGKGSLRRDVYTTEDIESTFLINFDYKLTKDINLNAILGNNILQNKITRVAEDGKEFKVPSIFTMSNVKNISSLGDDRYNKRNVGFFADVTLNFREYLFLNATGRNDISSSLPKKNNSYFYPSVSTSFIITDAFDIKNDIITYAKLRAGYARVGRDADAEFTSIGFVLGDSYNSIPTITNNSSLGDQEVTPEFTTEFEVGTDLEFWKKRIVVDFTTYKKTTTQLITPVTVPSSSGYDTFNTNIGAMENKGVEIGLTLIPIKTGNFRWTLNTTFTKNKNTVTELKPGLDRFNLSANTPSYVIPGESFGVFYGTKFARDANGSFLINPTGGGILQDPNLGVIGDPNPDFKMSFINSISYKGFNLKAQVDWKKGGDFSSVTIQSLLGRGVTKDTEDREKTWVIPGYYGAANGTPLLDSNGNQIPNTIQITTNDLYFSPGTNNNTFAINSVNEASIYDGTVYRLRELSLGYDFPSKILKNTGFTQININLIGNNLWYFAPNVPKYTNFDPEVTSYGSSRIQGVELSAAPTSKRYGIRVSVSF